MLKLVFLLLASSWRSCSARGFVVNGPVLTVTLKDPDSDSHANKWVDLRALRPNAQWAVQSRGPPLPNWLPSLKSIRGHLGYNHADFSAVPSSIEGDLRFAKEGVGDLEIQPAFNPKSKKTTCVVQATRGNTANVMAQLNFSGRRLVEAVRGNFMVNLPFSSTLSAVKVSPAFDFVRNLPSCTMEGITGSGRTKAVLNLQYNEPTLSVVHALDER
jgi:hypothetical protein